MWELLLCLTLSLCMCVTVEVESSGREAIAGDLVSVLQTTPGVFSTHTHTLTESTGEMVRESP